MAKKFFPRALSVGLSLALCAGLVLPSFAASFADLQNAVNGIEKASTAAEGEERNGIDVSVADGKTTITLYEDVKYKDLDGKADDDAKIGYINITNKNLTLNLNGYTIDGGNRFDAESGEVTEAGIGGALLGTWGKADITVNGGKDENDSTQKGTLTGGNYSGILVGGGGSVTVNHANLTGNRISGSGGAVYAAGGISVTMDDVELKDNYASWSGGAVEVVGGTTNLTNVTFTNNHAGGWNGGGINIAKGGTANLANVKFENNTAANDGGGLMMENWVGNSADKVTLTDCEFVDNKAGSCGGAISIAHDCNAELVNTEVRNNTAAEGGGILIQCGGDQSLTLVNSKVTGNHSTGNGGGGLGVMDDAKVTMDANSTISGNKADMMGGDIAVFPGTKATMNLGNREWTVDTVESRETKANEKYVSTNAEKEIYPESVGDMNWGDAEQVAEYRKASFGLKFGYDDGSDSDNNNDNDNDIILTDEEIPLAGVFTRADAIGYLWRQAGEPEWELSDFADVPEDHEWAVAIGWAQDMGIARADEEGNFRPDDLVLRSVESLEISPEGELQEFLNWYAAYAGVELDEGELFIQLEGAWDDVIMGEEAQVIFDDFFARLEAALSQAA